MASTKFSFASFFVRLLIATTLVMATFNPLQPYSYFYWALRPLLEDINNFSVLKAFLGVVLLIGWTVFLRATLRSLGIMGTLLAIIFFGLFFWLLVDQGWVSLDGDANLTWLILIGLSGVLSAGLSWSLIRRRMSGQYDVDDPDN
ncbi:MAG: LPXTG cell wall anchor domain-containing protein [Gammaproteobacteria bacterium]|nr:LPXTG cell wall anchor domain-containing protein [Gammaproteobacteria bacterium]